MADRGIGNSPNLLKAIENLGMFWMMRVSKGVRMWLAMSAAHLWMLSLGAAVCRSQKLRRQAVGRKWNVVNVFRLGLALFQLRLQTGGRIPCALCLPTNLKAAKNASQ